MKGIVKGFFDVDTNTISYVVSCAVTKRCAVIDSVWNYKANSGVLSLKGVESIVSYVKEQGLTTEWILDTHMHADHITGCQKIKEALGGKVAIGKEIVAVQKHFVNVFNITDVVPDGSQWDRLLGDNDEIFVGDLKLVVLHVPCHTPADSAYYMP